jgi:hypothetical protein
MRKTNPIAGEARGTGPQGQGTWGHSRETNPIRGGAGRFSPAPRPSGLGPGPEAVVQNKANFAECPGRAGRGPIVRHRLDAPLRETKPIPAGGWDDGRGPGVQTKPISVRPKLQLSHLRKKIYAMCARLTGAEKQSQFSRRCRSGDRRSQAPGERNKPNFGRHPVGRSPEGGGLGDQFRETKPIRPQEHKGRRSGQLCKTNPIPARGDPAPRRESLSCKTKPIPLPGWWDFAVADDAPGPTMLWNAAWNRARLSEPRRKGATEI